MAKSAQSKNGDRLTHVVLEKRTGAIIGGLSLPSLRGKPWSGEVQLNPIPDDDADAPPGKAVSHGDRQS